ncbi:Uncharacterized protein GBIM_04586 [Gryllus bimaculatus]|nr:Uncharacterized protein GBIM_04586 [Gryllus bimaculatus]
MPLKGLQVVELAGLAPAPFCGMLLADFGASVIRVDRTTAGRGEELDCLGNGKKSIAINLKSPKGVEVFRKLCSRSDVLIEPFRKGIMEKLGLGPMDLLKENPKLIYARLTGFGQFGKYSSMAGHDINYVSISGLLSLFGRSGERPIPPTNLAADFGGGGLMCAFGIILALLERARSGKGQIIDASMVDGTAYLGSWLYRSQHLGIWGNPRGNNLLDTGMHFYEVYETKDGKFMAVGALEPQFYDILMNGLGISEDEVPQFGDTAKAKKVFTEKFKSKTQEEWCKIFNVSDACVTPVLSLEEAVKDPHNSERSSFVKFADDPGRKVPGPAPILSRTPGISKACERSPRAGLRAAAEEPNGAISAKLASIG